MAAANTALPQTPPPTQRQDVIHLCLVPKTPEQIGAINDLLEPLAIDHKSFRNIRFAQRGRKNRSRIKVYLSLDTNITKFSTCSCMHRFYMCNRCWFFDLVPMLPGCIKWIHLTDGRRWFARGSNEYDLIPANFKITLQLPDPARLVKSAYKR